MVIICLRKISNINPRETLDPMVIDNKKNFVKKIFQFFDFYLVEKRIEKKIPIVKNIIVVLIFFDRFDRQFSRNSLKNYFSDEPKWMINYLLEILQTNTINNHFTDLTDYFYFKDCDIFWKSTENTSNNYTITNNALNNSNLKDDILETTLDNISNINQNNQTNINLINNNISNNLNNLNNMNNNSNNNCENNSNLNRENSASLLESSCFLDKTFESFKPNWQVDKINNLIYEKYENKEENTFNYINNNANSHNSQLNSAMNGYTYWSSYTNNLSMLKETPKDSLLDSLYDYSRIYEEFIAKIGEPKSYLSVYKHIIIKEVIVFIQISVLGYEKIPKINIPYSTLINHFYRVVENSNTSIDYEILIAFIRIIKKYGEQITDEWSDIFKILNIIIRREENKNYDKLIKVLYEILDRIKLLIISQKFNGVLSEYINFLDEFKTFPYDSLMILKCKYKLNSFLNYISKLESVIIENLIK